MSARERMRSVAIGVPSGTIKLTLWEGTEDERSFPVCFPKNGRPFVKAFGTKYELTDKEAEIATQFKRLPRSLPKST